MVYKTKIPEENVIIFGAYKYKKCASLLQLNYIPEIIFNFESEKDIINYFENISSFI